MHCFGVSIRVRPGTEGEATALLRRLTEATRREPGNILYIAHQVEGDPCQFFIYEQYHTTADHAAHRQTDHYRRYAAEGLLQLAESRTSTHYTPLEPSSA